MFEVTIGKNNEQHIAELIAKEMSCEIIGKNILYYDNNRVAGEVDAVLMNKHNDIVFLEIKERKKMKNTHFSLSHGKSQLRKAVIFFNKKQNDDCAWTAQHVWVALKCKENIHLLMKEINDLKKVQPWQKIQIMFHG